MKTFPKYYSNLCCAALLGLSIWATPISAQSGAESDQDVILIADSVFLRGNNILTAEGNVEAVRGDTRLTATAIIYDSGQDSIRIEGPIKIEQGGDTEIYASFAELDTSLQNGLLESARVVLNQQVELTASRMRRSHGRISTLDQVSATSCKTCNDGRPPLWQIRAKRVRHDQLEKQLYFDDAQFRIMDVPVFYLPRLRLPDPTLKRATGFLAPELRTRTRLATGVKVPYFIRIGDHKDLTLTPYISANTRTLEWRYRQAFRTGDITFEGAFSDDDISNFGTRAYVFGKGKFNLRNDYKLSFDLKLTSDDAYLAEYDYGPEDRLRSELALGRVNRRENTRVALTYYESLRDTENNDRLPSIILSARKQHRFFPSALGGEAWWELETHSHYRRSTVDKDADGDGVVDGRDVSRLNAELGWRDTWLTQQGIEFGVTSHLAFDAVATAQDATNTDDSYVQFTPTLAAHLRYPLIRTTASGATQILEPIAQIGWSGGDNRIGSSNVIANDESTRVEFDEGNLLALSRFPSDDRRERGLVGAWGVNWSHTADTWNAHLTLGQVIREEENSDFSLSSGFQGTSSDYLLAGQIKTDSGLVFTGRSLIDDINGLNKAEARGGWYNDTLELNASYVWLDADADEDRNSDLSEWNLDGRYRVAKHWTGLANWRFDVASKSTAEAGIGVEYRNECVNARFAVSRRFTSSTTVRPSTDLSFTVEILGFSAQGVDKSYTRTCSTTAG